jgi:predicted RNA-binding Zn-ribbon protein involved in translation (DUF1610 family)
MITFECTCGAVVRAADHLAGKVGKCPKCGALSKIPLPGAADSFQEAGPPETGGQNSPISAADPVPRTRSTWVCANCEQAAGRLEKPREWNGNIVCPTCYAKLQAVADANLRRPPAARKPASTIPNDYAFALLGGLILMLIGGAVSSSTPAPGAVMIGIGAVVFGIALCFLPYGIARYRNHPNTTAICILCFFSWSGIVWLVALVWSVMAFPAGPEDERPR